MENRNIYDEQYQRSTKTITTNYVQDLPPSYDECMNSQNLPTLLPILTAPDQLNKEQHAFTTNLDGNRNTSENEECNTNMDGNDFEKTKMIMVKHGVLGCAGLVSFVFGLVYIINNSYYTFMSVIMFVQCNQIYSQVRCLVYRCRGLDPKSNFEKRRLSIVIQILIVAAIYYLYFKTTDLSNSKDENK